MKKLSSSNILLALIGLLISFFITIGSAKTDAPKVNVCVYSLIVAAVVSLMAEAFRLLVKDGTRWQWERIVAWLCGGSAGTLLGFYSHNFLVSFASCPSVKIGKTSFHSSNIKWGIRN